MLLSLQGYLGKQSVNLRNVEQKQNHSRESRVMPDVPCNVPYICVRRALIPLRFFIDGFIYIPLNWTLSEVLKFRHFQNKNAHAFSAGTRQM